MSIIFTEGFDSNEYLPLKWDIFTSHWQTYTPHYITTSNVRHGRQSLCIHSYDNQEPLGKTLESNEQGVIFGFAYKPVSADNGYTRLGLYSEGVLQNSLRLYSSSVSWSNHDGSTTFTSTDTLIFDEWNFIEFKVNHDTVSGTVDIKVDEISIYSEVGVSTSTTNNYIDKFEFYVQHITAQDASYGYVDDFYMLNVSGTHNNDFIGDCTISLALPNRDIYHNFDLPPGVYGVPNNSMVRDSVHKNDETIYTQTVYETSAADDGCVVGTTITNDEAYAWTYNYDTYLTFYNISIPKNAKILECNYFGLADYSTFSKFNFQKSGTPVTQVTDFTDWSNREFTSSVVANYSNIGSELQQLVNLQDWQENDNVVLLKARGMSYSQTKFYLYEYTGNPLDPDSPHLEIKYQLPGGDSGEYVHTKAGNTHDSYGLYTEPGIKDDIMGISYNINHKKEVQGIPTYDLKITPTYTIDGTTYSGTPIASSKTQYTFDKEILEVNPKTGLKWTIAELESNSFGFVTIED